MLLALFQTDQVLFLKASIFILFTEVNFHIHINTADRIDNFNQGIEAYTGIVINRDTEEVLYRFHTVFNPVVSGMRQLVVFIIVGGIRYVAVSWQRHHINVIRLRIDNQNQIRITSCLLVRTSHIIKSAQIDGEGILCDIDIGTAGGIIFLFVGLNDIHTVRKAVNIGFGHIIIGIGNNKGIHRFQIQIAVQLFPCIGGIFLIDALLIADRFAFQLGKGINTAALFHDHIDFRGGACRIFAHLMQRAS